MRDANRHSPALPSLKLAHDVMQLPHHATLPDGSDVTVDVMTDSQLSEMYALISDAARLGEGYGVDEWPTEAEFRAEIDGGSHFVVHSSVTGLMIGAFSLAVSKYYRGTSVRVADPVIIVPRADRRRGVGEFVFQTVVSFSRRLGYSGIYTDIFENNVAMIKILERYPGMQRVGNLPLAGQMPDGSFVGGIVYFKDLRSPSPPISR